MLWNLCIHWEVNSIGSRGLDVVFGTLQDTEKRETRFTSTRSAKEIISTIEEAAKPLGFNVQKCDYKMKLQGDKNGRKGHLSVATQVWSCCYHSCGTISDVTKLQHLTELISFVHYLKWIECDFASRYLRLHHLFTWWSSGNPEEIHWSIIM